jgi:hypothetical protein
MRQLVFVHGRAQQHLDAVALKAEWTGALKAGLAVNGLTLPLDDADIRFPYYGDALYDMVKGAPAEMAAEVIVRGEQDGDPRLENFMLQVLEEVQERAGISGDQLASTGVVDRGVLNWEWVQGFLKAIDRYVPGGSGATLALATNDVFQYLTNSAIRQRIEDGIVKALAPGVETVVVSHSLGTVVAYNLLRREGHLRGWKVPLFVTVGSPLGVTAIRKMLRGMAPLRCPECASAWFNAMDDADVVALYPLDTKSFPLNPALPAIANKVDVKNRTSNRHGISGYLDDAEVARTILNGLS